MEGRPLRFLLLSPGPATAAIGGPADQLWLALSSMSVGG